MTISIRAPLKENAKNSNKKDELVNVLKQARDAINGYSTCPYCWGVNGHANGCKFYEALQNIDALIGGADRLAAYEDIGLSPEEITDMIYRFEAFLCEMTGNRMSKSNYTLDAMISAANDYQQSLCDGCWDRSELAKYYELEHEKRLVVLPCKVGTRVWVIGQNCDLCRDMYAEEPCLFGSCEYKEVFESVFGYGMIDNFGKTVFLTRAEAEAALKGDAE